VLELVLVKALAWGLGQGQGLVWGQGQGRELVREPEQVLVQALRKQPIIPLTRLTSGLDRKSGFFSLHPPSLKSHINMPAFYLLELYHPPSVEKFRYLLHNQQVCSVPTKNISR
jgi:hypothetical protein